MESVREVIQRQAQWSEEVNDFEAAGEMYMKAKKYDKAAALFIHQNLNNKLIEIVRTLPSTAQSHKILNTIAAHFVKSCDAGGAKQDRAGAGVKKLASARSGTTGSGAGDTSDAISFSYAKEVFVKLNDLTSLVDLCIKYANWDDAISVAKQENSKEMVAKVYIAHARWLAENEQFEAARKSYLHAGRPDEVSSHPRSLLPLSVSLSLSVSLILCGNVSVFPLVLWAEDSQLLSLSFVREITRRPLTCLSRCATMPSQRTGFLTRPFTFTSLPWTPPPSTRKSLVIW